MPWRWEHRSILDKQGIIAVKGVKGKGLLCTPADWTTIPVPTKRQSLLSLGLAGAENGPSAIFDPVGPEAVAAFIVGACLYGSLTSVKKRSLKICCLFFLSLNGAVFVPLPLLFLNLLLLLLLFVFVFFFTNGLLLCLFLFVCSFVFSIEQQVDTIRYLGMRIPWWFSCQSFYLNSTSFSP